MVNAMRYIRLGVCICILLFVLTGIGCWALCAASDTDEYDDEEIEYDQNDDNKFN